MRKMEFEGKLVWCSDVPGTQGYGALSLMMRVPAFKHYVKEAEQRAKDIKEIFEAKKVRLTLEILDDDPQEG